MGFLMNELGLSERRSCRMSVFEVGAAVPACAEGRRGGGRPPEGAGLGEPPIRLPPAARDAAAGGAGCEPQADLPALHRGGPAGADKEAPQAAPARPDRPAVPARPMQRWSLDFVSDQLADCRRFRVLNIVDDHSRFCPGQIVDVSISGARVARYLVNRGGKTSHGKIRQLGDLEPKKKRDARLGMKNSWRVPRRVG